MPAIIAIVGPTASGKSAFAEEIALALDCPVISVDAMQVYRGMDIGTAKTPVSERRVPLLMVDVAEPDGNYSAQMFQEQARRIIDAQLAEGKDVVLCGGTGLYLDAVIDEMVFPKGDRDAEARARYESIVDTEGSDALWKLLRDRDPRAAELIHPNNTRRVVRALEMADEGVSYADQVKGLHEHEMHYPCAIYVLTMNRQRLYARIEERVDLMFEQGLVSEVEGLLGRGLGPALTAHQAIGYKEVLEHLEGRLTLEEAKELVKRNPRRYAKRQLSWFKRDPRVRWIDLDSTTVSQGVEMVLSDCGDTDGR
ncbi:MAG: tRNA (adenosine(37)-N6)-dimethylallyltransferase MiaA [Atopobiaceae bacterium]|nr:tRNA (adenosine(37)-N6)-dimethylallyltransferase MiaA [Atopobiaceae bacterium]